MALSAEQWADAIRQAGAAYGVNPALLSAVNRREQSGSSGFVVNDWDSNAKKGTPSGGPFQFIQPTFSAFSRQARAANPAAWRGVTPDWKNPVAQALTASWAFKNGKGSHWSTFGKALSDAGGSVDGGKGRVSLGSASQGLLGGIGGGSDTRKQLAMKLIFGDDPFWNIIAARQGENAGSLPVSDGGATGQVRVGGKGSYKGLIELGKRFGLNIQGEAQTTGGNHTKGSYHYQSRAVDFGDATNSPERMNALASYVRQHPSQFKEFFWAPAGFSVKNGKVVKGNIAGGHEDHIHVAW